MLTVVDGVLVPMDNIDDVPLNNIGAVEVYRGPSEMPPEFNYPDAVCGVVLIWTRTADPAPARATRSAATPAPSPAPAPPAP
jgi:hypothetical protein